MWLKRSFDPTSLHVRPIILGIGSNNFYVVGDVFCKFAAFNLEYLNLYCKSYFLAWAWVFRSALGCVLSILGCLEALFQFVLHHLVLSVSLGEFWGVLSDFGESWKHFSVIWCCWL